jgi:hypothetical protein
MSKIEKYSLLMNQSMFENYKLSDLEREYSLQFSLIVKKLHDESFLDRLPIELQNLDDRDMGIGF